MIHGLPYWFAAYFIVSSIACGLLVSSGLDEIKQQSRGLGIVCIIVALSLFGLSIGNVGMMVQ